MFRVILNYLLLLKIAYINNLLYDFSKPHIYLVNYEIFHEAVIEPRFNLASVAISGLLRESQGVSLMLAYTLQHPLI